MKQLDAAMTAHAHATSVLEDAVTAYREAPSPHTWRRMHRATLAVASAIMVVQCTTARLEELDSVK